MQAELIDDGLDSKHQELVAEVDAELQARLKTKPQQTNKYINNIISADGNDWTSSVRPLVQPTYLSGTLTQHRVDEGHDGRLHVHLLPVAARTPVQVVQ